MPRVDENLILFVIYSVIAGVTIPLIGMVPPVRVVNHLAEWGFLPIVLLPIVAAFGLRSDRITDRYLSIVAIGFTGIILWGITRVVAWLIAGAGV